MTAAFCIFMSNNLRTAGLFELEYPEYPKCWVITEFIVGCIDGAGLWKCRTGNWGPNSVVVKRTGSGHASKSVRVAAPVLMQHAYTVNLQTVCRVLSAILHRWFQRGTRHKHVHAELALFVYVFLSYTARQLAAQCIVIRDVRKPNFGSVSVYKNPNRTEPNRSQKVKSEISVSAVILKTEFVSYI